MRENLRVQFELRNSYEELRNQLEEWEEDKKWKAREESNRRANVEQNLPTILEEEGLGDFENAKSSANSQNFEDSGTRIETDETEDLI